MLEVEVHADAAGVGRAVAVALVDEIDAARKAGRVPVVGWPVGRTPLPVVPALALLAATGRCRLDDVHVALMDDYVEPSADGLRRIGVEAPCSCRGAALRDLVAPLTAAGLSADRLHSPEAADPAGYDDLLAGLGGVDVFVVALGASDGHVALNPPGTPGDSRTRVVDLAPSTRRDNVTTFGLGSVDEVPERGVTVGLGTITDARRLLVLAFGAGKREVVDRLLGTDRFAVDLPASAVLEHPAAVLHVDEAAHPGSRP